MLDLHSGSIQEPQLYCLVTMVTVTPLFSPVTEASFHAMIGASAIAESECPGLHAILSGNKCTRPRVDYELFCPCDRKTEGDINF